MANNDYKSNYFFTNVDPSLASLTTNIPNLIPSVREEYPGYNDNYRRYSISQGTYDPQSLRITHDSRRTITPSKIIKLGRDDDTYSNISAAATPNLKKSSVRQHDTHQTLSDSSFLYHKQPQQQGQIQGQTGLYYNDHRSNNVLTYNQAEIPSLYNNPYTNTTITSKKPPSSSTINYPITYDVNNHNQISIVNNHDHDAKSSSLKRSSIHEKNEQYQPVLYHTPGKNTANVDNHEIKYNDTISTQQYPYIIQQQQYDNQNLSSTLVYKPESYKTVYIHDPIKPILFTEPGNSEYTIEHIKKPEPEPVYTVIRENLLPPQEYIQHVAEPAYTTIVHHVQNQEDNHRKSASSGLTHHNYTQGFESYKPASSSVMYPNHERSFNSKIDHASDYYDAGQSRDQYEPKPIVTHEVNPYDKYGSLLSSDWNKFNYYPLDGDRISADNHHYPSSYTIIQSSNPYPNNNQGLGSIDNLHNKIDDPTLYTSALSRLQKKESLTSERYSHLNTELQQSSRSTTKEVIKPESKKLEDTTKGYEKFSDAINSVMLNKPIQTLYHLQQPFSSPSLAIRTIVYSLIVLLLSIIAYQIYDGYDLFYWKVLS